MMTIDDLYPQVTEAILRAERLEDRDDPGMQTAYHEVSLIEEKIAELLPASDLEGAIARWGAVRAAVVAKDSARAQQLAERFLAEAGLPAQSRAEIRRLMAEAESAA